MDAESLNARERKLFPYALRQLNLEMSDRVLESQDINVLRKELRSPSPSECVDNIVLYLGRLWQPGIQVDLFMDPSFPWKVGVDSFKAASYVIDEIERGGLIRVTSRTLSYSSCEAELSFSGWQRYEAIRSGQASLNVAFMALQFGDQELQHVVEECFKPAVRMAGFELRLLNDRDHQKAGLIDDRLRVTIRSSRFLVVDLTHNNNGAYWEAGYGEGLGKPVVYTCKKEVFDRRAQSGGGTHFDTNHHLHILWRLNQLEQTGEELLACIRATIPEAKQASAKELSR